MQGVVEVEDRPSLSRFNQDLLGGHFEHAMHRLGWHRSGRFPAALQLLLAGAILGALIVPRLANAAI